MDMDGSIPNLGPRGAWSGKIQPVTEGFHASCRVVTVDTFCAPCSQSRAWASSGIVSLFLCICPSIRRPTVPSTTHGCSSVIGQPWNRPSAAVQSRNQRSGTSVMVGQTLGGVVQCLASTPDPCVPRPSPHCGAGTTAVERHIRIRRQLRFL